MRNAGASQDDKTLETKAEKTHLLDADKKMHLDVHIAAVKLMRTSSRIVGKCRERVFICRYFKPQRKMCFHIQCVFICLASKTDDGRGVFSVCSTRVMGRDPKTRKDPKRTGQRFSMLDLAQPKNCKIKDLNEAKEKIREANTSRSVPKERSSNFLCVKCSSRGYGVCSIPSILMVRDHTKRAFSGQLTV